MARPIIRRNAQLYIRSIKQYPLLLDVALPIFGWAIHFQNNKVKHLISKPNVSDFENAAYFHPIQNGVFRVKKSLFLNGYYLKENDEIKLEIIELTFTQFFLLYLLIILMHSIHYKR